MSAIVEIPVTNLGTLLAAAKAICRGFGQTAYWYRGHADLNWRLIPAVHRSYSSVGERVLVGRFRLQAPTRAPRSPSLDDMASWLCLMQHFGLPTRLLDWTASLAAAAYFAVSYEPRPGDGAIWVLVPSELNKSSTYGFDGTMLLHGHECNDLVKAAFDGTPCQDQILAAMGPDVDIRMTVQQGAFTIHPNDGPLEQRPGAEKWLAKFIIPESAKAAFDEELWVLGIRRSALFPDVQNLALDLASDHRLIPKKTAPPLGSLITIVDH